MKDKRKAEEVAAQRVQLLAPLLAEGLDSAKELKLRKEIAEQNGLSERTMRRYLERYRNGGFQSLAPKSRGKQPKDSVISEIALEQAILLRREVPSRSIAQIIQILEWEGLIEQGEIKRSTLQEKLASKGYSTRHMKLYQENGVAARRFQHKHRNQLWHSDIKFGPYLPIGPNGKPKQVYLVAFLDDATRFVLHGEFYPVMDQVAVEHCFCQALYKHGVPETVYFDYPEIKTMPKVF